MSDYLLEVKNLSMHYDTLDGNVDAVKDISFSVKNGESFGLVGESGCGKTSVAMTLLQLQPDNSVITEGSIKLDGKELIGLSENELRKVRWDSISIVFQGAMNAWNPVIKIGEQIREAMREHSPENSKQENIDKINQLFSMVGLDETISDRFPHELSGGMKQRAVIALALSCDPKIIIADEPTTALDVVIQDQILNEIKKVQDLLGLSLIYISHDIAVIAEMTDKIAVMYAGSIVEIGPTKSVFESPKHAYTKALLDSTPSIQGEKKKLASLDGEPPSLINEIKGKVDLIILLVNTDRSSQSSLAKNFPKADFIFTSGSTHRTSASMPQKPEGPYVYSNGKQGKYLTVVDLDINNSTDTISDDSAQEQKIKQLNNRLKRLQKKDPTKALDDIYAGQDNILSLIKRYRNDLSTAETILQKAKNKMRFTSFALNKKIKDDPEILAMVDDALDKCVKLDKSKKSESKDSHHNHNHSKKYGKKNN